LRTIRLITYVILAVFSFASLAHSQDVISFDRSSFGKAVWSQTESTVSDIQLELSIGDYKNEPIINYSDRSELAQFGRSVGRLDVLTDRGIHRCTAFIVSKQYILTNYHCSIGVLDNTRLGATRIEAISFVTGYTQTGVEEGTNKYIALPNAVEFSKELDYAVLEVIGNPSAEYGELKLASLAPQSGDPFWIIGHPMGEGQRVSREKCRASEPAVSVGKLLHTCDTLPGNSGSPVIDVSLRQVVALHHAGSQKDSVNFAILMSEILKDSKILTAYKVPEALPTANAEPAKTAEAMACDALYTAASEAKACFAYEAYFKSCRDHSLAPIADGYINEFCQSEETVTADEAPKTTVVKKTCQNKFIGLMDYDIVTINAVATPSVCTDTTLCMNATKPGSPKVWHSRSKRLGYVKEAKKRGLTCGVEEKVTRSDGKCKGEYNVNTWTDCTGTRTLSSGVTYVGSFKDGEYHGQGTYTLSAPNANAGLYYVGEFKGGLEGGQGTYTVSAPHKNAGFKYAGELKEGKLQGQGTYTFSAPHKKAGTKYVGNFKDDKEDGQGTKIFSAPHPNAGAKYVGEFKGGEYHGQGTFTLSAPHTQAELKYVGRFRDGKFHGQGTVTYANDANGFKYIGIHKDGKRHGQGTYIFPNGDNYVGTSKANNWHGQGTYTTAKGVTEGIWKNNVLQTNKMLIKALQTELNRIGCAVGPEDGVSGKKTVRAIKAYTKKYGIDLPNTWKTDQSLHKFIAYLKTEKSTNYCPAYATKPVANEPKFCNAINFKACGPDFICSKATIESDNTRVWIANTAAEGYVEEAKSRGLKCGVGESIRSTQKITKSNESEPTTTSDLYKKSIKDGVKDGLNTVWTAVEIVAPFAGCLILGTCLP